MTTHFFLMAAVALNGVVGENLRARAYFDANNVTVGDPMVLTIDFLGNAKALAALHAPSLSQELDAHIWRLDDASAKTDTLERESGRRLIYRVRPLREGVLYFPALEFEYVTADGASRMVMANAIPVHARVGDQVVVEGMQEDFTKLPDPPELITECCSVALSDDEAWNWRRACARPSAAAFAKFDCVEGRQNEARMAILEGDFERALKLYRRLEWRLGQTPEIERGIIAALARKYANPLAELPVWRQVLRFGLRYGWVGRLMIAIGVLVGLIVLRLMAGKFIRALAMVAIMFAFSPAFGDQSDDPFLQRFEVMRQQMRQLSSGVNFSLNGVSFDTEESPEIKATYAIDSKGRPLRVGDAFDFVLTIVSPSVYTLDRLQLTPSVDYGLRFLGQPRMIAADEKPGSTNSVCKIVVSARYDVPFKGMLRFTVNGMVSGRKVSGGAAHRLEISFQNPFACYTQELPLEVSPLTAEGRPKDFSGIIATKLKLEETADSLKVGTNDVIVLSYVITHDGYHPEGLLPPECAFEWSKLMSRSRDNTLSTTVVWKRYFVADGADKTPPFAISYYNPSTGKYCRATVGGKRVSYRE